MTLLAIDWILLIEKLVLIAIIVFETALFMICHSGF